MIIQDDNATTSSSFTVDHTDVKMYGYEPQVMPPAVPVAARRKKGRMRRRHSVDFKPTVEPEVKKFDPVEDENKAQCWYSKDEYDIIKARNSLIVKMMKTGHFQESDEHSFRGLEHKTRAGFKQRRANKFNALNAVLEEQDRQANMGVFEPEKIAKRYRRVSLNAAETAVVVASRDAEESLVYAPPRPPTPPRGPMAQPEGYRSHRRATQYYQKQQVEYAPPVSVEGAEEYGYGDYNHTNDTTNSTSPPPPADTEPIVTEAEEDEEPSAASPETEQQHEMQRLQVRGLFAAASMMKASGGRMGRRSSM